MCCCDVSTQAYWATRVVARKRHRCNECRQDILLGERYERVRAIWDNEPAVVKTCLSCLEIRERVEASKTWGFCWCHGTLLEDVRQEVEEWAADDSDRLWVEARLKEM